MVNVLKEGKKPNRHSERREDVVLIETDSKTDSLVFGAAAVGGVQPNEATNKHGTKRQQQKKERKKETLFSSVAATLQVCRLVFGVVKVNPSTKWH